jgi:hypothetical protein
MERLEAIEKDLAMWQNEIAELARQAMIKKRDREHDEAVAFIAAEGTDTKRRMVAKRDTAQIGKEEEAAYVGANAVIRVLEQRAMIGMGLLKSHGRA